MVAGAVLHLLPGKGQRDYTDEEREAIEDVLDAAVEWQAGRLPLFAFMATGTLSSRPWSHRSPERNNETVTCRGGVLPDYSRFVALVWAINAGDSRRWVLSAAIEAAGVAGMLSPRPFGV